MTTEDITEIAAEADQEAVVVSGAQESPDRTGATQQLLAKARYDAFKVMTETRQEAEDILTEARAEAAGIVKAAEINAEAISEKAASRAEAAVTSATEEGAAIVAKAHRTAGEDTELQEPSALLAEHRTLSDRVSTLRTLADQLEDRFAALAATTTAQPEKVKRKRGRGGNSASDSGIDYRPSVDIEKEKQDQLETEQNDSEAAEVRGSFYNRRSANLPRLGTDNSENVASMTRSLRKSLESE